VGLIPDAVLGMPGAVLRQLGSLGSRTGAVARSERRVWVHEGKAHLEVRAVHRPEGEPVARAVEKALEGIEGVDWAEVNPILARVVVSFDGDQLTADDLVGVVDSVEDEYGLTEEGFPGDRPDHPADVEPLERTALALGADLAGVGLGVIGRLLRLPRLPIELAGAVPVVESLPPVRRALDVRPALETAVIAANALLQGLNQGPLGLTVDAAHRVALIGELSARRRAWHEAEARLHPAPGRGPLPALESLGRPVPLPKGLIETYGERASLTSLGLAGIALAATRDPRRAADVLLAGIPRAARLGREGFASQAGRGLAARGILPMDGRALRLLDRVDTVVLDAALLSTGRHVVAAILAAGDEPAEAVERRAAALLDLDWPERAVRRRGWTLAPVASLTVRWPRGARTRARELARTSQLVLGLAHGQDLTALVSLELELDPAVDNLVATVRRAGFELVLAGGARIARRIGPDRVMAGGERLVGTVRALQAEGHVVALISSRPGSALRAADCGIGVVPDADEHPPWGAHLLCPTLSEAAVVVGTAALARTASRQSAGLALAGSTVGTLFALQPLPGAGQRAISAVNFSTLAALAAGTWTGARLPDVRPVSRSVAPAWHAMDADHVLRRLSTTTAGLAGDEATRRLHPEEEAGPPAFASLLAAELTNPLSVILGGGAALSAAVGSITDAVLIGGVLGLNAVVGTAQRLRTEQAIGRLTDAVNGGAVRVLRGDTEELAAGPDLVPGDVVVLEAGDAVAADCRVLEAVGLEADESALTGESLPVTKGVEPVPPPLAVADRRSMVYAGTSVAAGRGRAVVVATGHETEAGRGAASGARPPPSGVETRLRTLTDITVPLVLGAGAGLALNGLVRGRPMREAVGAGVSLATAAVPEGLPFVATVAQASAAHRLSLRGVLVRNPGVLETLGRVDVLCFDKTGTLTEGRLQLRRVSDGAADDDTSHLAERRRLTLAAALRATPHPRPGGLPHPTDQAVVSGASSAGVPADHGAPDWKRVASLHFEPARGYHAVLGRGAAGPLLSVKGAPEVVLPRCTTWRDGAGRPVAFDRSRRSRVEAELERLARQGLRVLAVAERPASGRQDLDDDRVARLELLGYVAVADVARPSAAAPVAEMLAAGISVVMVTGDHPTTAEAIAADLGLLDGRRVLTGPELGRLDDDALDAVVDDVAVFARVAPADKVRIVQALQRTGKVVAMTGDGANDAQAIRLADVGVAFGPKATPAARDAADLVVVDDRVDTLIDAIAEGRAMWASVRDALALLLGGNLGEVVFTTGAALVTGQSPLTPRQLLAVNLFTDLVPAMAIAVQPPPAGRVDLRREGPETSLAGALARDVAVRATATSLSTGGAWLVARATGTPTRARTVALATLVGTQLGQTLAVGGRSPLVLASMLASAGGLVAVIGTPGLSQFFDCRPLGPMGWGIALTASGVGTAGSLIATSILAR